MNQRRILRAVVPVDDAWHTHVIRGRIVHVASRQEDAVEFWWLDAPQAPAERHSFRVFGTGQPIDFGAWHVGTASTPTGQLVWHLFGGFADE